VEFVWKIDCEASFHKLTSLLTHAPILKIVDTNKDFLVCTDACKERLGGVFIQTRWLGSFILFQIKKRIKGKLSTHWLGSYEIETILYNGSVKINIIYEEGIYFLVNGHRRRLYQKPLNREEFDGDSE